MTPPECHRRSAPPAIVGAGGGGEGDGHRLPRPPGSRDLGQREGVLPDRRRRAGTGVAEVEPAAEGRGRGTDRRGRVRRPDGGRRGSSAAAAATTSAALHPDGETTSAQRTPGSAGHQHEQADAEQHQAGADPHGDGDRSGPAFTRLASTSVGADLPAAPAGPVGGQVVAAGVAQGAAGAAGSWTGCRSCFGPGLAERQMSPTPCSRRPRRRCRRAAGSGPRSRTRAWCSRSCRTSGPASG